MNEKITLDEALEGLLRPTVADIPDELVLLDGRWSCWQYQEVDPKAKKPAKVPIDPLSGHNVSSQRAWRTFEDAAGGYLRRFEKSPSVAGIGLLLTQKVHGTKTKPAPAKHRIIAFDFDNCRDPVTGKCTDKDIKEVITRLRSYTEVSPSGKGFRVFGLRKPQMAVREFLNRVAGIEMYMGRSPRYVTVTGRRVRAMPAELRTFEPELIEELHRTYGTRKALPDSKLSAKPPAEVGEAPELSTLNLSDDAVAFLEDGTTPHGDRSRMLVAVATEVLEATATKQGELRPEVALAVLMSNDGSWQVAMDHRGHNELKAKDYLWEQHVLPASVHASPVGDDDLEELGVSDEEDDGDGDAPSRALHVHSDDEQVRTASRPTLGEFYADAETGMFIFSRNNRLWPVSTIDKRFGKRPLPDGTEVSASTWLHRMRGVDQMSWVPGRGQLIANYVVEGGGLRRSPGSTIYNLYTPPRIKHGDPKKAKPWVDHVKKLYPEGWQHVIKWFAHRVQRPGEKVNHALVLHGASGIGKDTLLAPVIKAVGQHNTTEISPQELFDQFNTHAQAVICRISEVRDMGDTDRFKFYERSKTLLAAPPETFSINDKHTKRYSIPNVVGVIFTTNHLSGGMYLPAEDRRHFVVSSPLQRGDLGDDYFDMLWGWLENGGAEHVAAYLSQLDLSDWDAKEPPPHTEAWHTVVDGYVSTDASEVQDALEILGEPQLVTVRMMREALTEHDEDADVSVFYTPRKVGKLLEEQGYRKVVNMKERRGRWSVGEEKVIVWRRRDVDTSTAKRLVQKMIDEG